ncbi:MAG: MerR family transcriptional regulator [Sphingobium sp.]
MTKADGAFLTISELAGDLGLPQHILRYWETRFPQLRPLQRSGNRRYYRPDDVMLVRRINQLLNVQGFTVRGAQKALAESEPAAAAVPSPPPPLSDARLLERLEAIRADLAAAIGDPPGHSDRA